MPTPIRELDAPTVWLEACAGFTATADDDATCERCGWLEADHDALERTEISEPTAA